MAEETQIRTGRFVVVSAMIEDDEPEICIAKTMEGGKIMISPNQELYDYSILGDKTAFLRTRGWEPFVRKMKAENKKVFSGFRRRGGDGKIEQVKLCNDVN